MEFVSAIFGGLGSAVAGVASGGILALVSTAIKGIGAYMQTRQEQAFRREEWANEIALRKLEMDARDRDTENELAIAQSEGSWRGLDASYNTVIASAHVPPWVNAIRSLFRPALTIFLLWMAWRMFAELMAVLRGDDAALIAAFSPEQAGEAIRYIVYSIVYTACTGATWWYGDRALTPTGMKSR